MKRRLGWCNRNYVGTHFGGSLYAMTDPFLMLMLLHRLGSAYVVAHKSGSIDYLAPARGLVQATFRITEGQLEAIRVATASGAKHEPVFEVDVHDTASNTVARATCCTSGGRRRRPESPTARFGGGGGARRSTQSE